MSAAALYEPTQALWPMTDDEIGVVRELVRLHEGPPRFRFLDGLRTLLWSLRRERSWKAGQKMLDRAKAARGIPDEVMVDADLEHGVWRRRSA